MVEMNDSIPEAFGDVFPGSFLVGPRICNGSEENAIQGLAS